MMLVPVAMDQRIIRLYGRDEISWSSRPPAHWRCVLSALKSAAPDMAEQIIDRASCLYLPASPVRADHPVTVRTCAGREGLRPHMDRQRQTKRSIRSGSGRRSSSVVVPRDKTHWAS